MKEKLSLVLFTLLAQAGVGLAVVAQLLGTADDGTRLAHATAMALTALGLSLAFTHLGTPFGAHRALFNLRTSWLSRECLLLGTFLGLGALTVVLEFTGAASLAATAGWLWIALGLAGLFSMASIYGRTAIPAWSMAHTHLSFFTAAVSLGGVSFALLASPREPAGTWALVLAAGAVALQLVEGSAYLITLGNGSTAAQTSMRRLNRLPLRSGMALTLAGGLGFPLLAHGAAGAAADLWLCLSLACLATGQALVRYAYYASAVHAMAAGWTNLDYHPGQRLVRPSR